MDERQLVELAGAGNEDAFEQLVKAHEARVYHLALRMTGDRETAFDLTQETFLKAWHAIGMFQFDSKFSTWLCRIASNTCIDHLRRKRRYQTVSLTDPEESRALDLPDSSFDPAVLTERAQDREAVLQALEQLPVEYRTVLSLRALEDMSYEEIGQVLDMNPGTVKSRIFRAREKMRQLLLGNFFEIGSSKKKRGGMQR